MAVMYVDGQMHRAIESDVCIRCNKKLDDFGRLCGDCKRFLALEKCRNARDDRELSQNTSE